MTARQHKTVIGLLCIFFALLLSLSFDGLYHLGIANADVPAAVLDAGAGSGSGSAVIAPAPAPLPAVLVDPASNPAGFINETIAFAKSNWWIGVGLALFGFAELLALLGKDIPLLAWLGRGRVSIVLGGSVAVLGATLQIIVSGGPVQSALFAGFAALMAYAHPAAKDVAAAQLMKA